VLYLFSEFSVAYSGHWRRGFSQNGCALANASQADAQKKKKDIVIDDRFEARKKLRMQIRVGVSVHKAQFLTTTKYINL
jgi:hypothetical protein